MTLAEELARYTGSTLFDRLPIEGGHLLVSEGVAYLSGRVALEWLWPAVVRRLRDEALRVELTLDEHAHVRLGHDRLFYSMPEPSPEAPLTVLMYATWGEYLGRRLPLVLLSSEA